jgi:hypothetical protein
MTNKEAVEAAIEIVKNAIETYEATLFICPDCKRLAYMIDPGDGIVSHAVIKEDGTVRFQEIG